MRPDPICTQLADEAVRAIRVLPEVRSIATRVSKAMLGEENRIGLFGPPWTSSSHIGATESLRQFAPTTGLANIFYKSTHLNSISMVNVAFGPSTDSRFGISPPRPQLITDIHL